MARAIFGRPGLIATVGLIAAAGTAAQDAPRGAGLYLQLPGVASCVSCHGPDLLANRNGFLRAADNPQALRKALNAVGVMGYLEPELGEADLADLSAFLGHVAPLASGEAALQVWPLTLEFGVLGFGAVSGLQTVRLRNRGSTPLAVDRPLLLGDAFTQTNDCPALLAAGSECAVNVRYQASAPGPASAALALGSAASARPILVAMAGQTMAGARSVLQWQGAPTSVAFEATLPGQERRLTISLVNAGADTAVLGNTSVIGPQAGSFSATGCPSASLLAPSAQCTIELRYAPTGRAGAAAVFQLRSDGANPSALALTAAAASGEPVEPSPPSAPGGGGALGGVWLLALLAAGLALRRH